MEYTGSPLGDQKVKQTLSEAITKTSEEMEQWKENANTEETVT